MDNFLEGLQDDFLNRFPRARARAFLVSKKSNLVSKLPTNSTGSPAHAGIDPVQVLVDDSYGRSPRTRGDRPRVCLAMDLGLIVDPEASEANQGRPDGTASPAGEKVSEVGVISL